MSVVILGGGLAGLTAAYRLSKEGFSVKVIEKNKKVGGLASSFRTEDYDLDVFFRHIFKNQNHVISLIKELGLGNNLIWSPVSMGFYDKGSIERFDNPLDILTFKPLNLWERFLFSWGMFKLMLKKDWKELDSVSAKEWMIKTSGYNVYDRIWKPMLKSKFGEFHEEASAAWFWGRIKERKKSKSALREVLGYLRGSFQLLANGLEDEILENNGQVIKNSGVKLIGFEGGNVMRVKHDKGIEKPDIVISTLPTPVFLKACSNVPDNLQKIKRMRYMGTVCVCLGLKEKLSDFYWVNIIDEKIPFTVFIEHTNFVSPSNYNNRHIIYLGYYMSTKSRIQRMNDNSVLDFSINNLKKMFPKFSKKQIIWAKVFRNDYAAPVYQVGFSEFIPKNEIDNLFFAGMHVTYPYNRTMENSIKSGGMIAKKIIENLC